MNAKDELFLLKKAVRDVYEAGFWECRTVPYLKQIELWTKLRDAASIPVGTATAQANKPKV